MTSTSRTAAYADAVVAMATGDDVVDLVETELMTVARAVETNRELRDRLIDTLVPVSQRLKFVESEALTAAHPTTRAALAMVIAGDRAGDLMDIAQAVSTKAAARRDRELAEVHVAAPLDDARREELTRALERATGKTLEVKVFVDPSIVGGVRARIGDTVIDGSIARRLEDVRTRITG